MAQVTKDRYDELTVFRAVSILEIRGFTHDVQIEDTLLFFFYGDWDVDLGSRAFVGICAD